MKINQRNRSAQFELICFFLLLFQVLSTVSEPFYNQASLFFRISIRIPIRISIPIYPLIFQFLLNLFNLFTWWC